VGHVGRVGQAGKITEMGFRQCLSLPGLPASPALPRAAAAALLIIAGACGSKPPMDDATYAADIARARAAKDADFANSSESPVPDNVKAKFLPLAYFPIDAAYSVPAMLEQSNDRQIIEMPTSVGARRQMQRVGTLHFSLKGQSLKLSAFVEVGSASVDHLFVPFTDLTSGTETYPAGRYLDLDRNATGIYVIDFNRAYHPYCYYNPTFDCPYPPAENRLTVPVRAGERTKK
jgi:uncharacterized protein (DUF1684 family)